MVETAASLIFERDYSSFPEFARYKTPLEKMFPGFILNLQETRTLTGIALFPSPNPAGWARTTGDPDSRHYAIERLSDAGDIFPERGSFMLFFNLFCKCRFGGGSEFIRIRADRTANRGR